MMKQAVFIIRSPFEMLCAVNAIKEFSIYDFDFYIVKSEDSRSKQIEHMAELFNIEYSLLERKDVKYSITKAVTLLFQRRKIVYPLVFVGDYRGQDVALYASTFLTKHSEIIFLDDGSASISILNDSFKKDKYYRYYHGLFRISLFMKGIKSVVYFTIFEGIPSKYFIVRYNNLTYLLQNSAFENSNTVFVIGTNTDAYCNYLGITEEYFVVFFTRLLNVIKEKYPRNNISFIPHGRDSNKQIEQVCSDMGICYAPLTESIETYLIVNKIRPFSVYGWTSTALYSIKSLYPDTKVYNIVLPGTNDAAVSLYNTITKYYESKGINSITL